MTPEDHDPMSTPDGTDELVSAYLDGEATTEERSRVEGDAVLLERVEQMRQLSQLVGDAPAPSAARRDASIAAALARAEVGDDADVDGTDIAAWRERRARRQRFARVASIAAVVVGLALIAIPVLGSLGGTSDDMATSGDSADSSAEGTFEEVGEAIEAEAGDGDDGSAALDTVPQDRFGAASGIAPPVYIGAFETRQEAVEVAQAQVAWVVTPAAEDDPIRAESPIASDQAYGADTIELVCSDILDRQAISADTLVWWGRFDVRSEPHDYLVFIRDNPTEEPRGLFGFVEVTTDCRIVETGVLDLP